MLTNGTLENVKTCLDSKDRQIEDYLNNPTIEKWNEILNTYWFGIIDYAYSIVKDSTIAHDCSVETFEKARKNIRLFDHNKGKFSTWIWTICRNFCISVMKRQKTKSRNMYMVDINDIYESKMFQTDNIVSETNMYDCVSPENKDKKITELYDVSVNEIRNMPGSEGQILKMKLLDNMKIVDISKSLNINENTVKSMLYKGKRKLIDKLKMNFSDLYENYAVE